jgi:hypothetical protein
MTFLRIVFPLLTFCLSMISAQTRFRVCQLRENRCPPRYPSAGQAFSGSCSSLIREKPQHETMFCLGWTGTNAKSHDPIRNSLIFYLWQIWAGIQAKLEPKCPQEGEILIKSGAYSLLAMIWFGFWLLRENENEFC